jgi:hypothetical protein
VTDFGTLNVMLNRHMPKDALVVDLARAVQAGVPRRSPARVTSSPSRSPRPARRTTCSFYGEVGLAYGNEKVARLYRGLATRPSTARIGAMPLGMGGIYLTRGDRADLRRLTGGGAAFTINPLPAGYALDVPPWDFNGAVGVVETS